MYYCDFCNKKLKKKESIYGHIVCSKHMHQLFKYGKVLDNNPRTQKDFNEFRFLDDNSVEFDVYNQRNEKVNSFIIDKSDFQKIRYKKWRIDTNSRIITGNCTNKNPRRELSRFLLDVTDETVVVDHIDCNPLNNRRNNLRICTQSKNVCNKSFMSNNTSGIIGVSWDKARNKWAPEIRLEKTRCHLGRFDLFEEAVYARHIAELKLFKEYKNPGKDEKKEEMFQTINDIRKKEIELQVITKLTDKFKLSV